VSFSLFEVIAYSVGSAAAGLVLLFIALTIGVKILAKTQSSGASSKVSVLDEKIALITNSISIALEKFEPLSSASELESLDIKKETTLATLRDSENKLKALENALTKKQEEVNSAETSHNDLKRAKEASEILADEIVAKKSILEAEYQALEEELSQSLNQLEVLSSELNLTPQQQAGITKIENSLANSQKQLKILVHMYQQGSTRFTTLQDQYKDLEKEFTKLVEKELTG